jgi:alkylation response protein AidB-like acyl-CoA dehydrogenase
MWEKIVELGWPAITVPEAFGGLGMDYIDLIMIIGEMGRTLAPAPLFGTLAGAWAIEAAGSQEQKQELLSAVAGGTVKLALAVASPSGELADPGAGVNAMRAGGGYVLSGAKSFVVDAASADKILVVAGGDQGNQFFLVDAKAPGVTIGVLDWRDITRQVCSVAFDGAAATLLEGGNEGAWDWVRDRLYLVLAAESSAGIAAVLADAVDYAKQRIAFGKPIGAFQAIKHQLAEIVGQGELTNAAVQYAAWALSMGAPDASKAAAMAQSYASEAYKAATHRNIQVFGAIGFTWEMKNHLFYKRARANSELLGSPRDQREQVIRMLEREAA